MWFLILISWLGVVLQLAFVTLALAAGLYYLAELVEEYTVLASRVIRWTIFSVLSVYIGLFLFEDLPTLLIACGLISQLAHLLMLRTFPFFIATSPPFIVGVVMIFVNHYLAFQHFTRYYYGFSEVMAYFTICLWLVPFGFFVSLSANENILPTLAEQRPLMGDDNDVVTNYFSRKSKKYGLLSFFNFAKDTILPQRVKKSF